MFTVSSSVSYRSLVLITRDFFSSISDVKYRIVGICTADFYTELYRNQKPQTMKNLFFSKTLLVLSVLAIAIASCKKEDKTSASADLKLIKIASWNPSTGVESVYNELIYDNDGKLKSVIYNRNTMAVSYNGEKVISLIGKNNTNGEYSFKIEYNAAGKVSKVTHVNMSTIDYGNVRTYTYNAGGKISQTGELYTASASGTTLYVRNYTWDGDNLASSSSALAPTERTEYVYDNKINPYYVDAGIGLLLNGGLASKNNAIEIKNITPTVTGSQKRTYEYNASGYATSMKLMDGSNEGTKFYYNK